MWSLLENMPDPPLPSILAMKKMTSLIPSSALLGSKSAAPCASVKRSLQC